MEYEAIVRPGVVLWYRVYCAVLALLYGALSAFGLLLLFLPRVMGDMGDEIELDALVRTIYGWGIFGFAIPMTLAHFVAIFLPPRRWVWVYGVVLLSAGTLIGWCMLAFTVPLLVFWVKQENRAFHGW
jgi:hypothetical protein